MDHRCTPGSSIHLPELAVDLRLSIDESTREIVAEVLPDSRHPDDLPSLPAQLRHDLRNELNAITVGLRLLKDEYEAFEIADANETFDSIQEHLQRLNNHPMLVKKSGGSAS